VATAARVSTNASRRSATNSALRPTAARK
jgi:hypothetical protein